MWTISDKQMQDMSDSSGSRALLPCEQVEVMRISSFAPAEMTQKEILKTRWLSEDNIEIKSSLTQRNVKIQVSTNGFFDGEKLKAKILDNQNKTVKELELEIEANQAVSYIFEVEEEWLDKVLFIKFES